MSDPAPVVEHYNGFQIVLSTEGSAIVYDLVGRAGTSLAAGYAFDLDAESALERMRQVADEFVEYTRLRREHQAQRPHRRS